MEQRKKDSMEINSYFEQIESKNAEKQARF